MLLQTGSRALWLAPLESRRLDFSSALRSAMASASNRCILARASCICSSRSTLSMPRGSSPFVAAALATIGVRAALLLGACDGLAAAATSHTGHGAQAGIGSNSWSCFKKNWLFSCGWRGCCRAGTSNHSAAATCSFARSELHINATAAIIMMPVGRRRRLPCSRAG